MPARRRARTDRFSCCCSVQRPLWCFALIAQIGEQVDYLRFLPLVAAWRSSETGWWAALLAGGPGWIVIGT